MSNQTVPIYLGRLGLKPSWPEVLVPYAGGEMGNSLPMGVYLENYLLKGSSGSGVGRSAAATTWMLIKEIGICLVALLVFGAPAWPWVRLAAAFILVGMLLLVSSFSVRAWCMAGWNDGSPTEHGCKRLAEEVRNPSLKPSDQEAEAPSPR